MLKSVLLSGSNYTIKKSLFFVLFVHLFSSIAGSIARSIWSELKIRIL